MMMALAATAMSVIGKVTEGNQADKVGTYNANILNQNATAQAQAGTARENNMRDRNAQTLASQRASLSANGVDATSGSALVGTEQNARDADLDALTMRYENILQVRNTRTQADMALYEGKAKKKAGQLSAFGQIIGAAGNYMSGTQMPAPGSTATPKANPYYTGK